MSRAGIEQVTLLASLIAAEVWHHDLLVMVKDDFNHIVKPAHYGAHGAPIIT